MKFRLLFILLIVYTSVTAQPAAYTSSNIHSHNDYEKRQPFDGAWQAGAGSIEADVHLVNGELLVAHDPEDVKTGNTIEFLYLDKINRMLKENNGYIYSDTLKDLQVLIDIKTTAVPTLQALITTLNNYPLIITNRKIRIVISGNRPGENTYSSYPSWIAFDGRFNTNYSSAALSRVALISGNFRQFSTWNGKGDIDATELQRLKTMISEAHLLKKPVRFWATPDEPEAWRLLMSIGVDYLNTDRVAELSGFLRNQMH